MTEKGKRPNYPKEFKQDAVNTLFRDYQFSPSSSK
jgi:transposase-like protein